MLFIWRSPKLGMVCTCTTAMPVFPTGNWAVLDPWPATGILPPSSFRVLGLPPSVADTLGVDLQTFSVLVLVTYLQVTRRWIVCSVPLSPRIAECPRPVDEVDLASLAGILNLAMCSR